MLIIYFREFLCYYILHQTFLVALVVVVANLEEKGCATRLRNKKVSHPLSASFGNPTTGRCHHLDEA